MLQYSFDRHHADAAAAEHRRRQHAESDALADVIRSLRRNINLIAATTAIGAVIAVVLVLSITQQYYSAVTILVDPRQTRVLQDTEVVGRPGTDNGAIESEVELLKSDSLIRKVAEKLELRDDDEFGRPDGLIARLKSLILLPLRIFGTRGTADPLSGVIDKLGRQSDAKRRGLTYVIELGVWSRDATKAAKIANAFAEVYLADQIAAKSEATARVSKWLNQRVEEMRARLAASERAFEKYKAEEGLFDPGGENLSNRQIAQLNDQLVDARAKAAAARAKYDELKSITPDKLVSAAASSDVLQSSVVSNLRGQYADAARQQAEREARYGFSHPAVTTGRAQVADLEKQITAEISRIVASARSEFEIAASRQRSLEASLDDLKERAAQFNQAGVRLREFEREVQANRELFQSVLARAKQTSELGMEVADSRVVSSARPPSNPSYPRRMLVVGLGVFGSLGLGIALALGRDAFGRGFRRTFEIEQTLGLQPLASVPFVETPGTRPGQSLQRAFGVSPMSFQTRLDRRPAPLTPQPGHSAAHLGNIILNQPDSAFAESIRTLYFGLRQRTPDEHMGVLLVTSALTGEGKSTVALSLARTAAQADAKVLLIDCDLRRPTLASALGFSNLDGLAGMLTGHVDLETSVKRDTRTGLYAIAGTQPTSGAEALALLSSPRMQQLIEHSRQVFDLVVIDAPPLLPVVDTRLLLSKVNGAILVVASERTSRDAIATALHEIPELQDKVVGVVLNRAPDDFDRYYKQPSVSPAGDL